MDMMHDLIEERMELSKYGEKNNNWEKFWFDVFEVYGIEDPDLQNRLQKYVESALQSQFLVPRMEDALTVFDEAYELIQPLLSRIDGLRAEVAIQAS